MEASGLLARNRYALGNLYVTVGKLLGPWWWMWPAFILISPACIGYLFPFSDPMVNFLFVCPAFSAVQLSLIPHPSILLPGGRAEKRQSAIITGFVVTFLLTVLFAIIALMTVLLASIMPDISWRGDTFVFHAIDARKAYITLSSVPIALTVATLFANKMASWITVMIVAMAAQLSGMPNSTVASFFPDSIVAILSLIAAVWIVSAMLLRYHCRSRNLVN
jgi:hypothetical protein